jgi:DNA-directed RNA polymerase subunit H (RpoH/RPB5)
MASKHLPDSSMFKIKRNQIQMMLDRGYTLPKSERELLHTPVLNPNEFSATYRKGSNMIYVHYIPQSGDKVKKTELTDAFSKITVKIQSGINHIILISNPFNFSFDTEIIKLVDPSVVTFEIFNYDFFLVDPTRHRLMPPFKILTPEEISEELGKQQLSVLPRLSLTDPLTRWFALKSGDVVRVDEKVSISDQVLPSYLVV